MLKGALSLAMKLPYVNRLKYAAKAIQVAKAASVAAPMIWRTVANWDWSELDKDKLLKEVFGDDMEKLGKTLEGGDSNYVAFVGRADDGTLAYVGITRDFDQLTADHGGLASLSAIDGSHPMPLEQARALAEAVIEGAYERMEGGDLANTRHAIAPTNPLYTPALMWGGDQLSRAGFKW